MGATTDNNTIAHLGELCAKEFFDSLPCDERAIFQAADVAEALLREVESADPKHKDESVSRRASSAVSAFIAGINQYASALHVFANSNALLCPIWGSVRIVLHVSLSYFMLQRSKTLAD